MLDHIVLTVQTDREEEISDVLSDALGSRPSGMRSEGMGGEFLIAFALPVTLMLIRKLPEIISAVQKLQYRPRIIWRNVTFEDLRPEQVDRLIERMQSLEATENNHVSSLSEPTGRADDAIEIPP